jgi:hypothetical protein
MKNHHVEKLKEERKLPILYCCVCKISHLNDNVGSTLIAKQASDTSFLTS